ncbi:hypothetical protein D3C76_619440 [compost metagenome]
MGEVGHGGDAHVGGADLTQGLASNRDETGIDADGGGEAGRRLGLAAQVDDLLIGVVIVQGGQVHQVQGALGGQFQISHAMSPKSR